MARPSGQAPSTSAGTDEHRQSLNRAVGAANAQDRAWGYGVPKDGALAGKNNAVWAKVLLPSADGNITVPHALGQKPVVCELKHVEMPPGVTPMHVSAQPYNYDDWTTTTCQVHIHVIAGAASNVVGVFLVKGE